MKHIPVYIWTSNQLNCCLPAHAYLFNKFWPTKSNVKILGYDIPDIKLPSNFEFISLGKQRGPDYWSDDFIKFFSECEDEYFYFPSEDMLILDTVDAEILEYVTELFESNLDSNLLRFCLSNNIEHRPHHIVQDHGRFKVIEREQYAEYRNSVQASVWHRKNFLKQLKPNMSPWAFELNTGKHNGMRVLGTKDNYAITMGHGYKRGKKITNWWKCSNDTGIELNQEDLQIIETNNWMPEL